MKYQLTDIENVKKASHRLKETVHAKNTITV